MIDKEIKEQLYDLWDSNDGVFDNNSLKLYGVDFSEIPFKDYKEVHDLFIKWMGEKKFEDKLNKIFGGQHRVQLEDDSTVSFYVDSYALENAPFKIRFPKTIALKVIPKEYDETIDKKSLDSMVKDAVQDYFNEDVRLENLGLINLGVDMVL